MKALYKSQYAKTIVTIITAIILTIIIGTGSVALAAGSNTRGADSESANDTSGVDVTQYGASGSDRSDDTNAIQAVLDKYDDVYIPDGTYYINVDKMLHLNAGQTLTLSDGATLQALPTSSGYYRIISIKNVKNVTVTGGQLVGDRSTHTGWSGEWGMGIAVEDGSRDVTISNVTISDCWGDGVFLGDGSTVSNIVLDNVICDNNRRQGLSITNATEVSVVECTFKNTNGTAPEAGIDIEPDAGYTTENITIMDTVCTGNAGSGIDLMGIAEFVSDITITGCKLENNSGVGLRVYKTSDVEVTNTVTSDNFGGIEIPGDVNNVAFSGVTISDNEWRGVSMVTSDQIVGCSNIVFESTVFSNNSKNNANMEDGIRIDCWDNTGHVKDITFKSCRFFDDQLSKTQRYGITVGFSTRGLSGIVVESDCTFNGNISGAVFGGQALKMA